ncbi:MAG: hypothetical protein AB8B97_12340 [Granulosicoccus sp.]
MTNKRLNRIFLVLLVGVALICAWIVGQRYGRQEAFNVASGQLSSKEARSTIEQLQIVQHQLEQDLAGAVSQAEAASTRTRVLRDELDEQMRFNAKDKADLALYRRIESSEKPNSMEIDSVSWSALRPFMLELTLIQWQGRDRIKGQVSVTLTYSDSTISDSSGNENGQRLSDKLTVDLKPANFDFRFFQTIAVPIPSIDANNGGSGNRQAPAPDYLDIRINPVNERVKSVDARFVWSDVAQ